MAVELLVVDDNKFSNVFRMLSPSKLLTRFKDVHVFPYGTQKPLCLTARQIIHDTIPARQMSVKEGGV